MTRRSIIVAILLLATFWCLPANAQLEVANNSTIGTYTVATLPPSPATNTLAMVSDGSGSSCTSGGGSTRTLCQYNGAAWVVITSSGVGAPGGSLGQGQYFASGPTFSGVAGILYADAFTGADICIKAAAAITALPSTGGVVMFSATNYAACAATLTISKSNVALIGAGGGNPFTGNTGATTLNFPSGVTGIDISGDYVKVEDMFLRSASTVLGTDDGIRVRGSRTLLRYVTLSHFGRNGVRVDGSGGQIADFWHFEDLESNYNLGDGYQWAAGCSDNHAGIGIRMSAVGNGGWGFNDLCGASNVFESSHVSVNTLGGYSVSSSTNYFFNTYAESGTGSSFVFQSGSAGNRVWFANFGQPQTITDTTGSSNVIYYSDPDLYLAQDKMDIGPVPGSAGATNYALGSGQYANSDLSIYDRTNGAYLFNYNPTTKWTFRQRVVMTPTATLPGLNIGSYAGDPSNPVNGDTWYDSNGNKFRCRENGVSTNCIGAGGGGTTHNFLSATHTDTVTASPVLGDLVAGNSTPAWARVPGPTTPNGIGQTLTSTPSAGVATAIAWAVPGVAVDAQTGTSFTIPVTDDVHLVTGNNAAATAWTGFALANNYAFAFKNLGSGLITYTPASGTVNGNATQIIPQNWFGFHYTDNTNTFMPVLPTIQAFPSCADSSGNHLNFTTATGAFSCGTSSSSSISGLTTGFFTKAASATSIANSLCDEAITTANTLTCTDTAGLTIPSVQTGASPPACTAGSAGFWCASEGTEFTNVASTAGLYPDSTQHEYFGKTNGASTKGMMVRVQPGIIHQTAQTAAISTATLCAASAGACNIAGNYTVEWAFTQVGTACGTPGTGGVTFLLTWTDQNGTAHSATSLSMDDSASLVATTGTFHFTTSHATAWATGSFNLSSNGSIIQYATGYTACSVGTGSYQLDAWVTRKE